MTALPTYASALLLPNLEMQIDPKPKKNLGGRPRIDPATTTVPVTLRISPAQREKLQALGGASWVRRCIDQAAGSTLPAPTAPGSES